MYAPSLMRLAALIRRQGVFAALLGLTAIVSLGATTATATPPTTHTNNGIGGGTGGGRDHNNGGTTTTSPGTTSTGTTSTGSVPVSAPTSTGSTTGAGAGNITTPNHTGPGDNNHGDVWTQTVGPCADHNAEVLNHDADAMSGCNIAIPGGNPTFEPPAEPTNESAQKAEIGTTEATRPDQNPHLPCANIELMGKDFADASGNYSIDYWPPTGNKGGVYGKNTNGSSALSLPGMQPGDADVTNQGVWHYNAAKGGYQVMDIIDVSALVANAQMINPDPHDIQGYHFKLQYSQDPQKHKTFWVKCAGPTAPGTDCDGDTDGSHSSDADCTTPATDCDGDTDGSHSSDADCTTPATDCDGDTDGSHSSDADCTMPATDCDGDTDGSHTTDADCTTPTKDCDGDTDGSHSTDADCSTPAGGTNPVSGVQGASTNTPSSGVLGASITSPITGHPILSAALFALALVVMGSALLVTIRRRASDNI